MEIKEFLLSLKKQDDSSKLVEEAPVELKEDAPILPLESLLYRRALTQSETIAWMKERHKGKVPVFYLEYALSPIVITKAFGTWPTGKRGDRGFLLDNQALSLIPERLQDTFKQCNEKHGSRLVYVNEGIVGLPNEYYRLNEKKREPDELGLF